MRLFTPITEKEVIAALSVDGSGNPTNCHWGTRQIAYRIALKRAWSASEKAIWARFQKDVYAACRKAEKAGKIERAGPERWRGPGLVALWQLPKGGAA